MTVFNLKDDIPLKTAPKWDGQCVIQFADGKTMVHRVLSPTYYEDFPKSIYVPIVIKSVDRRSQGYENWRNFGKANSVETITSTVDYLCMFAGWHCGYRLPIYVVK